MRTALALSVLLALAPAVHGQTATMVLDLPASGPDGVDYLPRAVDQLLAVGRKLFFVAAGSSGQQRQVWVSDGTVNGTRQVSADPGLGYPEPTLLGSLRGAVLWKSSTLWRSDGTPAGTYPLTGDLDVGPQTFLDGFLYFVGCTAEGCGLWRSDGTVAGTGLVKALSGGVNVGTDLVAAGGRLYLVYGSALWASDGTAAGTGAIASFPQADIGPLAAAGPRLFLAVRSDRPALWTSDGTAAGTLSVARFDPALSIVHIAGFADHVDFQLYDSASSGKDQLWRSDGTAAGTVAIATSAYSSGVLAWPIVELGNRVLFRHFDDGGQEVVAASAGTPSSVVTLARFPRGSILGGLVQVGGRVLFSAPTSGSRGELWATDGTAKGTGRLPGPCAAAGDCALSDPLPLAGAGFVLAIRPAAPAAACELWRSDATAAGTARFASFPCNRTFEVASLGKQVFFPATFNGALWASDGTAAGTGPVSAPFHDSSSLPHELVAQGDRLFFLTGGASETAALWQTRGAAESTVELTDAAAAPYGVGSPLTPAGGGVFFSPDGQRLWRSDGTPAGTLPLADFGSPRLSGLAALGGELFFPVKAGDGNQLWKSDGTAAGTVEVGDLPVNVVQPDHWTAVGSTIYFLDDPPGFEPALWATDGTVAGTRRLYTFAGDPVPPQFTRAGSTVYFVADDRLHGGSQVWKTDGTPQGTTLIHAIDGPSDGSRPRDLVELAGNLYFFASVGTFDDERLALFRSDGTDAGTTLVKEFVEDTSTFVLAGPVVVGGTLFFVADDGIHGRELWKSDGTAAGTAMVRDIFPGSHSSQPDLPTLTVAGGRLYFSADDGVHGLELWQSDGTAAGTRLAQDIAPGAQASSPGELTVAGDRLYFAADDGAHGRELWALPLAASGCQPAPDHLCLAGGRFQVEADWRDFQGHIGRGTAVGLTGDTGYFWFFSPGNVEVVAKVLDGRGVNQAFWVFYGALSSVEYTLVVTDSETGLTRRYFNPPGVLASVGDTDGFGPLGASSTYRPPQHPKTLPTLTLVSGRSDPRAATGHCDAAPGRLCLQGGRFAVTADWKDFQGHVGDGTAVALTGDTGYFWFFDPGNVEVVAKVLDGRTLNGKFWLFYGALSSVEYTLTVTDTQSGTVRMYKNASGHLASVADTSAF